MLVQVVVAGEEAQARRPLALERALVRVDRAHVPLEVLAALEALAAPGDLAQEDLADLARLGEAGPRNLRLGRLVRDRVLVVVLGVEGEVGADRRATAARTLGREGGELGVGREDRGVRRGVGRAVPGADSTP